MHSSKLAAALGFLCLGLTGCNTVWNIGNALGGGGGSSPAAPKEAKAAANSASAPAPNTAPNTASVRGDRGRGDRGCVNAVARVWTGAGWENGELCIAPNPVGTHQVKLTLTGDDSYNCRATLCAVDVAFGERGFRRMLVFNGGSRGVTFLSDRDRIEEASVRDPVMSIRVTFDSGRWAVLKFDTRGFKPG